MAIQEAIDKAIQGGYPNAGGIFPGDSLWGSLGTGTRDSG